MGHWVGFYVNGHLVADGRTQFNIDLIRKLRISGADQRGASRRLVADELLAVIELIIAQAYADLLVGEVMEFL